MKQKEDTVNISKIVLNVNDKKIELSLSEAKQLMNMLNETFNWQPPAPLLPIYISIKRRWDKEIKPIYSTGWDTVFSDNTLHHNNG
jgi:hypothetical protein